MSYPTKSRELVAGALTVGLTAALMWFANGLNPWWPLTWFVPVPVLLFSLRSSWRLAATTAFLSILLGSLNMWHYFRVLQAPIFVWFGIYSVEALLFTLAALLFRALVLRGAIWSALLAFPSLWVCGEYLGNLTTPHGTAGSLAYTQLKFLPFLQLASITGPWGMSFLLMLFPAAVALGLHLRQSAPSQGWRVAAATLCALALALAYGELRLSWPLNPQIRVGLIASDAPGSVFTADEGADTERLLRAYAVEAERLAALGAKVIVLPEKLGKIVDPRTEEADRILQSVADKTGTTLVAGVVHVAPSAQFNQARIYSPGAPVLTYDKHHMLPPFELKYRPGTTITTLQRGADTWGVAICKDMDFTPLSRRYGLAGAGLLLVPGWDFALDGAFHGHMSVMRGVEDGFSVARSAKQGLPTVSDDRGRILGMVRSDSAPFATLLAEVPASHDRTFYLALGDWFPWLALALLLFAYIQLKRLRP